MDIISILKAAVLVLTLALNNPHATTTQKLNAIAITTKAVQEAQAYLPKSPVVTVDAPAPDYSVDFSKCFIDPTYGRYECGHKVNVDPIVWLDGQVIKQNGDVIKIKGKNRDGAVASLKLNETPIDAPNPYFAYGVFPTSSVSAGDKVVISMHLNPNSDPRTTCVNGSGEPVTAKDQTIYFNPAPRTAESLAYNAKFGYESFSEQSYSVQCSYSYLTPSEQQTGDTEIDWITVDFVK